MKKWTALLLPALLSGLTFSICAMYYGLLVATFAFLAVVVISVLAANLLLKNPFTMLLEGAGILVIDLNSTGIIAPFICSIQDNLIVNKKKKVTDIFDRKSVHNIALPISPKTAVVHSADGGISFNLSKEEFNQSRFSLYQYPVLFYNSQIQSLLTKDFISDQEKIAFAEHSILYQNRLIEGLNLDVKNFGRYVVESLKPTTNLLASKWTWILIIGGLVVLGFMFAPSIISAVQNTMPTATSAVTGAGQTGGAVIVR